MTESGRWLEQRGKELARREIGAGLLVLLGLVLAALALGVALGRLGVYRAQPLAVLVGWGLVALTLGLGASRLLRGRRTDAERVASLVERSGGLRRGSVSGLGAARRHGSASLAALADARVARWLAEHGQAALEGARGERRRAVGWSMGLVLVGGGLLAASSPGARPAADFWRPLAALARAGGAVSLSVDHANVRRGEVVTVFVVAAGRSSATLWVRAPGEPWRESGLALDSAGRAVRTLGPLESDRFVRATSGGRESATIHLQVSLPALLADLELMARYPSYLERPDEPLASGPDPVLLPVGAEIQTRGRATLPLQSVVWRRESTGTPLTVDGTGFHGRLPVRTGSRYRLEVVPESGVPLDGPPPELNIVAVPDSAPLIAVAVPGVDTTAPLSLRQPLVIDARDDHRLSRMELVSRRVSRLGLALPPQTDTLSLPEGGIERAVLQWTLDLNGRGYLPGDTAFYRVRAWDNSPHPQVGETREYRLRLPSNAELRQALREASHAAAAAADSLARAQRGLAQSTEELSSERERAAERAEPQSGSGAQQGDLPFRSAQRAGQIADQQQRLMERAQALRDEVKQLSEAASQAGLTDPQWQAELKQLQQLLDRAVTPDMEKRLQELRDALQELDPDALREALKRLAESGKELREQLARSRELFERAAMEGSMTTLAQDAQDLAQQQADWNRQAEAAGADSSLAKAEQALAREADSLAARMDALQAEARREGGERQAVADARQQTQAASQAMQQAAGETQAGNRPQARQSGAQAQQKLDPVAQQLRQDRDALRQEWRQDVLATLDHALTETADLAKKEQSLAQRMQEGDVSADARGAQAALREGADRVLQRLQAAAGKNALVSPQVGTSLGFARLRMSDAMDRLQRAQPNGQEASELAGQAVDGLNAMTQALLHARGEVQGAESGSGLQEAVEKMARLAQQQQQMNGQAGGMLSLMPMGGEGLMSDLRALAERQRRLAGELERMAAQGEAKGADELAQEARDLARRLEGGQLDRRTVERQERLFRRLLDQGRTLRGEEEDDQKERKSETARQDNVRLPPALQPGATGKGPKFPYPTWEQLQQLSPEDRRLILDYFRRLNEGRP